MKFWIARSKYLPIDLPLQCGALHITAMTRAHTPQRLTRRVCGWVNEMTPGPSLSDLCQGVVEQRADPVSLLH